MPQEPKTEKSSEQTNVRQPDINIEKLLPAVREIGSSILKAYFLVIMVVYPLYVKGGYVEIGDIKYFFFRNVSLISAGIMLPAAGSIMLLQTKKRSIVSHYRNLSVTDWFVYGYLVAVLVSYLFTAFRSEAFWGAEGWHMGLVSQLLFVLFYFFFSCYFKWEKKLLYAALFSSGIVFALGILNRYSVYPISLIGQTPVFISTLGNINWFCGYWAVICPLGILYYWNGKGVLRQAAAGLYVIVAFLIGIVQGSSSVFPALAALFLLLCCLSFQENERMRRFLELCMLFALSCQIGRLFRYLPGLSINYENGLGYVLTNTNATVYMGMIAGCLYIWLMRRIKRKSPRIVQPGKAAGAVLILSAAALTGYIIVLLLNTCMPEGILGLSGVPFFTFDDSWASARGATWKCGLTGFGHMSPFHKLIGAGPDCFAAYIYSVPALAEDVYARFGNARLTNAHNEWLTVLVNQGVFGCICYAGIFLSAVVRFLKKAKAAPDLYLFAAAVLVYMIHNMFSFQQILNTPFVFILLGIGEGLCRQENAGEIR